MDEYRKSRIVEDSMSAVCLALAVAGPIALITGIWNHNWWAMAGGVAAIAIAYPLGCILRI